MQGRETPAPREHGRLLPTVLAGMLVVLVATVWAQAHDRGRDLDVAAAVRPADIGARGADPEAPAGEAVLAARRAVTTFYTLDPRHARRDVRRMAALTTGRLEQQYGEAGDALVRRIRQQGLSRSVSLPDDGTATEYLTGRSAWVLVVADVHSVQRGEVAQTARLRTRVQLRRIDGRWLASSLETVPGRLG